MVTELARVTEMTSGHRDGKGHRDDMSYRDSKGHWVGNAGYWASSRHSAGNWRRFGDFGGVAAGGSVI